MADQEFTGTLSVTDKIGIGITTPIAQLHIFSSTPAPSQAFLESGGALLKLSVDASGASIGTDNAFPLSIRTDNSSRIVIGSAGDVTVAGPLTVQNNLTISGNTGLGTTAPPTARLEVNGTIRATSLMASGNIGIGTIEPQGKLDVRGDIRAGNSDIYFTKTDHDHTAIGNTAGYAAIENAANYDALMILGRAGTSKGRSVKLWDYLQVNGNLDVTGDLTVPNTGGGTARFTKSTYSNETSFKNNNVKLSLGQTGFIISGPNQPPFEYEFLIGHTFTGIIQTGGQWRLFTNFVKNFSINQKGDAYFAGAKTGFVADYFVNRVGDTLEQGDVVVISQYQVSHYSGTENDIPILEVDLTEKAYDTRVCGIVSKFVTEQDLPYVEPEQGSQGLPKGVSAETLSEAGESIEPYINPLKQFAAELKEGVDFKKVQAEQMGIMVTLGAFAHCKVDADIAPIEVGDLLTTSPTKGHAQKVLESERAVGSIVGKALVSLEKGKGKIPVLVMLQ